MYKISLNNRLAYFFKIENDSFDTIKTYTSFHYNFISKTFFLACTEHDMSGYIFLNA